MLNPLIFYTFYWSIVDLLCCDSVRGTAKWTRYTYTCIHTFLDYFPMYPITEY